MTWVADPATELARLRQENAQLRREVETLRKENTDRIRRLQQETKQLNTKLE